MTLPPYAVTFRGFPACPCLATWLPAYEAELQRRGILTGPLHIYQLIGGAPASGGTHTQGGAFDVLDLPGDQEVWVARQMGADATWSRPNNWDGKGGIDHDHGVLRGCPHNGPAAYQIAAVDAGFNGLGLNGHGAPDSGPRPLSGRTWQQGMAWARQLRQKDDLMAFSDWSAAEKKAFGQFIQDQVRLTLVNVDRDGSGTQTPTHIGTILRDVVSDLNALKKKAGA